ncbi:MAG: hypothetical protein H8E79_05655 [Desulfobulbaceae bacterium]|uniref:Uncharacterized protein n=1 Tax=Candidatus Desulfatifera sulfidica TaxID=2841691 RepID=A0A8J6N8A2_9BACT|nr:hypothetical protein [Candidatus Desulfatifera sulfidica]
MTFHCKNYDISNDSCKRLHGECIPGRRGCVLEGRVALSEELEQRIAELDLKKEQEETA